MTRKIPDDLSIPEFLRASGPGTPHEKVHTSVESVQEPKRGYGPSCWEETQKWEATEEHEIRAAVLQYKAEKKFAEFQQWQAENPELHAMNQKAKRDARRRIARLGVPPARRGRLH